MSDLPYIPFREVRGINRVDVLTREWNGVTAHYHEKYQGPGKVWGDMYSESSSLAVQLDARGGYSDPRFELDQPTPRSRYDTGFAVWVPSHHRVWGVPRRPTSSEKFGLASMLRTLLISWKMSLTIPSPETLCSSYTIRASHNAPVYCQEPALNR
jgi:hypothetical protein